MQNRNDNDFLPTLRARPYAAVLSDVLDELGLRNQAMKPQIRPLDDDLVMAGFARTGLFHEVDGVLPGENPYELEMRVLDDLAPGEIVAFACGGSRRIAPWSGT